MSAGDFLRSVIVRQSPVSGDLEEPIVASSERVSDALRDARRELIDLSRRNRLLNTPQTDKRAHRLGRALKGQSTNLDRITSALSP
jgi:hypothetical protein